MYKVVWKKGKVTVALKQADGLFVPKEKSFKKIIEIFLSVVAKRLVHLEIQKAGFEVSKTVWNTLVSILSQLTKETKRDKKDLTVHVDWLDHNNTHGSEPQRWRWTLVIICM